MTAKAQPKLLFVVQEDPNGGYIAKAPGYGIYTQGETMDELLANIKEAIQCHFEEGKSPASFTLHSIKRQEVAL
jgi:predicted RNase H-like HicB family nuclease